MTDLSTATHNFGSGRQKVRNLRVIAEHAQVIGCQEGSDQAPAIREFVAEREGDWAAYQPGAKAGQAATPMLVNVAKLGRPVDSASHPAVGRRWVGPHGAGARLRSKPKHITRVSLADDRHVLCTHMIPSATRRLKFLGKREWQARRRHYRDHVAAIVKVVESLSGDVWLLADFNAEPDFDLLKPIRDLGFTGWTKQATFKRRRIDHGVLLNRTGDVEHDGQELLEVDSDHLVVVNHNKIKEKS